MQSLPGRFGKFTVTLSVSLALALAPASFAAGEAKGPKPIAVQAGLNALGCLLPVLLLGGSIAYVAKSTHLNIHIDRDGDGQPDIVVKLNHGDDQNVIHWDMSKKPADAEAGKAPEPDAWAEVSKQLSDARDQMSQQLSGAVEELRESINPDLDRDGRKLFDDVQGHINTLTPGQLKGVLAQVQGTVSADAFTMKGSAQVSSEVPEKYQERYLKGQTVTVRLLDQVSGVVLAETAASLTDHGLLKIPSFHVAPKSLERLSEMKSFQDELRMDVELSDRSKFYGRNLRIEANYKRDPFRVVLGLHAEIYPSPTTAQAIEKLGLGD